tara:strand:+ start:16 stop:1410 length:1395 start_codon:yes stop_codon:yes gene_type:complete
MSIIIPANSAVSGGFEVANSLIFNSADSAYLNRAGAGGAAVKKMTYSFWVKRGLYGTTQNIMSFYNSATDYLRVYFNDSDRINVKQQDGGTTHFQVIPIRQYLDFSAWYHIVIAIDTSQGTAANRVKIYTNGVQETQFDTATYPSQERSLKPEAPKFIGSHSTGNYFDGYMAEFAFIVGTQNAQTDFGEFDDDSGIWKPIDVSGLTFGTNGFYLDFEDSSALGNDANGSNNFTVNNIAATDQATDTCTNNFATLNPLIYITNTGTTLSEGNNKIVTTASAHRNAFGTINVSSGKWYCEIKIDNLGGSHQKVGVSTIDNVEINKGTPSEFSDNASGYAYRSDGQKEGGGGSTSSYGNSFTSGDTLGIAMDLTNLKLYFSKNGTFQNSGNPESGATGTGAAFSLAAGESYIFAINQYGANTSSFNFGSPFFAISSGNTDGSGYGNFEYTVPSGYFSLNTKNLAEYG